MTGTAVANPDGSFTYSYEVANGGSFPIFAWSLQLAFDTTLRDWDPRDLASGGDITVSLGDPGDPLDDWIADEGITVLPPFVAQDFVAVDPAGSGDVQPGESLGGFEFTSFRRPGVVDYFEFGPSGGSSSGSVVGPIPEPSAIVLLALAAPLLGIRRRDCADDSTLTSHSRHEV